jgi:hypothetical protein
METVGIRNTVRRGPIMKRYICFIILCLFPVLVILGISPSPSASTLKSLVDSQEHSESGADLIAALDDSIQRRFLDIDKGFGFRRIIRPGDTPHRFKAENAKELTIVEHLTRARLDVVLYLAGRAIAGPRLNSADVDRIAANLIKGPVFITASDKQIGGLPAPGRLWEYGREAMRVFQRSDSYGFSLGDWRFIARPVRASDQSCLKCHQPIRTSHIAKTNPRQDSNSLQIGDPLGLVVYGYKNSDK